MKIESGTIVEVSSTNNQSKAKPLLYKVMINGLLYLSLRPSELIGIRSYYKTKRLWFALFMKKRTVWYIDLILNHQTYTLQFSTFEKWKATLVIMDNEEWGRFIQTTFKPFFKPKFKNKTTNPEFE